MGTHNRDNGEGRHGATGGDDAGRARPRHRALPGESARMRGFTGHGGGQAPPEVHHEAGEWLGSDSMQLVDELGARQQRQAAWTAGRQRAELLPAGWEPWQAPEHLGWVDPGGPDPVPVHDDPPALDGEADLGAAWSAWASLPPGHRPRDDPYPDELGQLFCGECETLCSPGRPCICCYADGLPGGTRLSRELDQAAAAAVDMVRAKLGAARAIIAAAALAQPRDDA